MNGTFLWDNAWEELGSPPVGLTSAERMAVAANLDGHLEIFVVGSDGAVWHTWQSAPNGNWSGLWASFGRPDGVSFITFGSAPVVEQNADGRLEVFLTGDDNNVWHIWQVAPNVNWIDQWASLGRPDIDRLPTEGFLSSLVRIPSGELEIFLMHTDTGEIWSTWQLAPNGGWADGWTSMGTPPSPGGPNIQSFIVVVNTNGQREVLAVGNTEDRVIWHNVSMEMTAHRWLGWGKLVDFPSGEVFLSIQAVQYNQDGRLELVCTDGINLWHTWQSSPSPNNWSGLWANFGQTPGGMVRRTPTNFDMRLNANGQLEGLTSGQDHFTYTIRQTAPNNGWTTWGVISSEASVFGVSFLMAQNQDKRLEAFSFGGDKAIIHLGQHG